MAVTSHLLRFLVVGELYSNDESQSALGVGNAGGVRVKTDSAGGVERLVLTTSHADAKQLIENPYHDRIEGNTLIYTGAGRDGDQTLAGVNKRIPQQITDDFPIYGFLQIGSRRNASIGPKRWQFLGLLEYSRHYQEQQVDAYGQIRRAWMFELRIHRRPEQITVATDKDVARTVLAESRIAAPIAPDDREIVVPQPAESQPINSHEVEGVRRRLLGLDPQDFEHLVKEVLLASGFADVSVTRFSQDGGIDLNAFVGQSVWPLAGLHLQVQAKRWLHTVGRGEVAELRGSLQPWARGSVITTSYFSRAAIKEATESGKLPIVLVDGTQLATVIHLKGIRFTLKGSEGSSENLV